MQHAASQKVLVRVGVRLGFKLRLILILVLTITVTVTVRVKRDRVVQGYGYVWGLCGGAMCGGYVWFRAMGGSGLWVWVWVGLQPGTDLGHLTVYYKLWRVFRPATQISHTDQPHHIDQPHRPAT